MRLKSIYIYLIAVLVCTSFANAVESTNHTITSGTFGVAWLNDKGIVRIYDGQTIIEPIPNIKISTISAADILSENGDQLVFLDAARQSLHIYSFKTKKLLGPFGHNVKTFAIGRYSTDESYLSVVACTNSGQSFRWTKDIMNQTWLPLPGAFSYITPGKLNNSTADSYAMLANSDGNIYFFSTQWETYSTALEGKNAVALFAGNFTDSSLDDIVFWDKTDSVFLYSNKKIEDLKQKVKSVTLGKNGENVDTLYAIDKRGKPIVYSQESKTWKDVLTKNVFACSDLVTQTNPDGKGHTLFVIGNGNLYRISSNNQVELLSDQQSAKIFLKSGNQILADYRFGEVPYKPYIEKLRTPSGDNILRDAPYDHLHHHGLMFAIAVNGCNFWEEHTQRRGKQITVSINPQGGAETSSLESELDWKNSESKTLIRENRKISVLTGENVTLLDWQTTLKSDERGANLDKSNHHYFGIGLRFDQTMDKSGRFFSDSEKNKVTERLRIDERLTLCRWMAYTAKLNGKPVTVAVLGHPSNPIPTTAFTMGDTGKSFAYLGITLNLHRQPFEMKPNSSLTFRYRVAVWDGEVTPATIEKTYSNFIK
ncbi:MAG: PmoA family protein [Planctomycetaceae bacterium]|jgi:hypothetical protein|nr:PmoA family protein [Planctomycetaceae bacterium]